MHVKLHCTLLMKTVRSVIGEPLSLPSLPFTRTDPPSSDSITYSGGLGL